MTGHVDILPNLQSFPYRIAVRRKQSQLFGPWDKMREAERRLVFCQWLGIDEESDGVNTGLWIRDSFSAFLFTYEAVLQFTRVMYGRTRPKPAKRFDEWLNDQAAYTVAVRGVRTLRQLEAHVESVPPMTTVEIVLRPTGVGNTHQAEIRSRRWGLHRLQAGDLAALRSPYLRLDQLGEWHRLARDTAPSEIMEQALRGASDILDAADDVVGPLPAPTIPIARE